MIIASAIKLADGRFFVGKRHGDCYQNMKTILKMDKPDQTSVRSKQGFINDKLEFLDRTQAYHEAFACGQCDEKIFDKEWNDKLKTIGLVAQEESEWVPWLASEDLW